MICGTRSERRCVQWPLSDVQAAMGHAHITTTMIYVHAQPRTHAATELGDLIAADLSPDVSRDMSRTTDMAA